MTLLAFLFPFLFFVAFPSRMWNFDGVACAAALELGNPVFYFHSNHLLYGFLGFLFWAPLTSGLPRALPALQLFTSIVAAAGLIGVYRILAGLLQNRGLALLLSTSISVTAVVWVWSIEAQVYALGFLALSWATVELFRPDHPGKWIRIGVLHAGAVLGHVVHVLWLIPALYWLFKEIPKQRRQKALRHYLLPLTACVAIPYVVVITGVLLPKTNIHWLTKWLLGSAVLNPNSVFEWHLAGWTAPFQWLATTPRLLWGTFWPYQTVVPAWATALTGLSIMIVVGLLGMSWKKRRGPYWIFSAIWLAVYGVFFWTWEPRTECYRMTDLIPLAVLFGLGIQSMPRHLWRWSALALLFLTFFPINLVTRIIPMHDERRNTLYQEVRAIEKITPENSLYLTAGGSRWIYLLYFSGRPAWNLTMLGRDPEHLRIELLRHKKITPVYIHADALRLKNASAWMSPSHVKRVGDLEWMQLL